MALPPFFDRVAAAATGTLLVSPESLAALLEGATPSVELEAIDQNSKWIAELSVNLLSRLFPRLSIIGDVDAVLTLRQLAKSVNPNVELVGRASEPALRLRIPGRDPTVGPDEVCARADGWVAMICVGPADGYPATGCNNPYASGVAACLAVSELTRRAFGKARMGRGAVRRLSILDYSESAGAGAELPDVDLHRLAFVGLGAVGNGAIWALGRHSTVCGDVWLVDDEKIELSNLQRYVLATLPDVGDSKTSVAAKALAGTRLELRRSSVTLAAFAKQFGGEFPIQTLAVSVDNVEGRRAAQALLPQLVVNGFTGVGSLGASWHRLDSNSACLACLYQPTGQIPSYTELVAGAFGLTPNRAAAILASNAALTDDEIRVAARKLGAPSAATAEWRSRPLSELYVSVVCGGVDLPIPGRGHSEVVPLAHQSALAGVLMAAELIKRLTPSLEGASQPQTLIAWHDVLRSPPKRWIEPRLKVSGCICGDPMYRDVFREKWSVRG